MNKIPYKLILCAVVIALYLVSIALFFFRNLGAAFLCFGISTFLGILIYLANVNEKSRRERERIEREQSPCAGPDDSH